MKDQHNVEKAYAYIVDCTLATVGRMACKKSRPKGEYKRQIRIAQKAIDWANAYGISLAGTRAEDVKSCGSVESWASSFEVKA